MIYTPKRLQNLYLWQESNLRIEQIPNLSGYSARKKRFLSSREGKKFLNYRTKKVTDLNGIAVWLVDGIAIRGEEALRIEAEDDAELVLVDAA